MDDDLYYKNHVFFCLNERPDGHKRGCCASKCSAKLHAYMKVRAKEMGLEKTRINKSGCLDRCEDGPVMVVYPEGIWYKPTNSCDIDQILEDHLKNGKIVERLKLPSK